MTEFNQQYLVIHLATEAQRPVHWLVAGKNGEKIEQGSLPNWQALESLFPHSQGRRVYLLLSAAEIGFHRVRLPGKHNAAALQAAPYLLEEQLASPIDQLHVVRLARAGEELLFAVIDHALLKPLMATIANLGIVPQALIPDVLLLPQREDGATAICLDDRWLIRTGPYQGMVAESHWLPELCSAWQQQYGAPLAAACLSPLPAGVNHWHALPPQDALALMAKNAPSCGVSLLQGSYAVRSHSHSWLKAWKKPLIALGVLVLLLFSQRLLTAWQLYQQANVLQQQARVNYRQLFPGQANEKRMRNTLRNYLQTMQSTETYPNLMAWLTPFSTLLAGADAVSVTGLSFHDKERELRITLSAGSFQPLEQLKEQAASHYLIVPAPIGERDGKVETTLILKEPQP